MINVYIRASPAVAQAVHRWQEAIKQDSAKEGRTVDLSMRYAAANDARAVANAVFHSEMIIARPEPDEVPTAEQWRLAKVEVERLQQDAIVYRQRLEEEQMRAARDREQAALDLARVVEHRDRILEEMNDSDPYEDG